MSSWTNVFASTDFELVSRLLLSVVLGFVIGLERELTNKSAGLRTNILVCVGSCLFTILSIFGFSNALSIYPMGDPARVAAQILTGIGFIGGGTVLRHGTSIYGITTAATLWITASVGMACGCGKFFIAVICTALSIATLTLVRIFERTCIPKTQKNNKDIKVILLCADENANNFVDFILQKFPNIEELTTKDAGIENQTKITFKANVCCKNAIDFIYKKFGNDEKIISISVKELRE